MDGLAVRVCRSRLNQGSTYGDIPEHRGMESDANGKDWRRFQLSGN